MVSEAKVTATANANKEQLALVKIIHQPIVDEVRANLEIYGNLKITNADELLAATHIKGRIAGLKTAARALGVEIEEASYGATLNADSDRLSELMKQLKEVLCSCKDVEKEARKAPSKKP